ncbi:MAG TPA: alpha/beta hydrolase [Ktedonosporobacter sp.]|jgi:pimeloyl-ACP methyl ester carboxylesterase|nr:alpha/beta hydrolase [Ktedonosporobacter sp.]
MTRSTQPEASFVAVNGTQLYYEVLGEGYPLVLIHGGYMDRRMWDDQFHAFAQHYRVIRYDVRGFGQSQLPPVPYADRQDLYALLNHLSVEKTYLLGLSLGGIIALDFTLEHPAMVDALILVGSPVPGFPIALLYTEEQLAQLRSRWAAFEKARKERDLPAMVDALMQDPTLVPSANYPAARQRVRDNLSEYSFAWVLDPAPRQDLEPPAYQRLAEIHAPTLIILGAQDDPRLFKDADKLERDIVGSGRVMIAETHHMPNMEKPEEFNAIVLAFLEKL